MWEMSGFPLQLSLWVTEARQGFRGRLKSLKKKGKKKKEKKANKKQLFSRWPLQNRAIYTLQVWEGSACLKYYKSFCVELLSDGKLFYIYIYIHNSQDLTWSVGFVMGPAIGHSAQSVFARVTNTKEENSLQTIRPEAWRGSSKCLFCDSSWFAMAAPINLCSNLWVSGMHSEVNCCLFYSVGVKAPTWAWMLSGEWGVPGCSTLLLTQQYSWKTCRLIYSSKMSQ